MTRKDLDPRIQPVFFCSPNSLFLHIHVMKITKKKKQNQHQHNTGRSEMTRTHTTPILHKPEGQRKGLPPIRGPSGRAIGARASFTTAPIT